ILTAPAYGAAAAFVLGASGVFALRAALTRPSHCIDPRWDIPHTEPIEPSGTERRCDVSASKHLIVDVRGGCQVRLHDLLPPVHEEFAEPGDVRCYRSLPCQLLKFQPFLMHLLTGFSVDVFALSLSIGLRDPRVCSET